MNSDIWFLPLHSTETAHFIFSNDLMTADSSSLTIRILDLSAAFDSICHSILLNRLSSIGINHTPMDWFKSYLPCRTQFIQLKSYASSTVTNLLSNPVSVTSIAYMDSQLFGQRTSSSWVEELLRCRRNITLKWLINIFFYEFLSQQWLHFQFYHEQATNPELNVIPIPVSATAAICNFSPSHPLLRGGATQALALHDGADVIHVNHARRRNVLWPLPCYL